MEVVGKGQTTKSVEALSPPIPTPLARKIVFLMEKGGFFNDFSTRSQSYRSG